MKSALHRNHACEKSDSIHLLATDDPLFDNHNGSRIFAMINQSGKTRHLKPGRSDPIQTVLPQRCHSRIAARISSRIRVIATWTIINGRFSKRAFSFSNRWEHRRRCRDRFARSSRTHGERRIPLRAICRTRALIGSATDDPPVKRQSLVAQLPVYK